jgi:hypothetical protein
MHRIGRKWKMGVALLAMLGACAAVVPSAVADRRPTQRERAAIRDAALKACGDSTCRFRRARVSTRNARYAWVIVTKEGFSAVLLRRPSRRSRRWRAIGTQGGGISECSYWERRAPDRVLRDLGIQGLVGTSGEVRTCGGG